MRRTVAIILLGLASGACAHFAWLSALRLPNPNDLDVQIAWMKTTLRLTDAQVQQLRVLHERSAPRALELAAEVASLREELAAFERARRVEGRIDFLELARFDQDQRQLGAKCAQTREQLVEAVVSVMTSDQRETYLKLLDPALRQRAELLN